MSDPERPGPDRLPTTAQGEFVSERLPREGLGAGVAGYRRIIANPGFRRLWIGQVISGIGDWLVIGLLITWVQDLWVSTFHTTTGSSFAVGGIMIAKIIPSLLYGSVLGAFVDRFDRRKLMIVCDLTNSVLALALFFTASLWFTYFVVLALETMALMFYPAKNALIPKLVEERDLAVANGLSYTTQQASMLIGLTMSGAIVASFTGLVRWVITADVPLLSKLTALAAPQLLGSRAGVFLDSATFLLSAAMVYGIKVSASGTKEGKFSLSMIGRDALDSFRFLGRHKELRGFLLSIGLAILGGGSILSVGTVYVRTSLHGGIPFIEKMPLLESVYTSSQTTFMMVFLALGMVAGAVLVPRLADYIRLNVLLVTAIAGFGLALLGFSLVPVYAVAAVFGTLAGYFVAQVTVAGNTYVSATVDDRVRGRVFTALESVIRVSLLLSMVVIAPLGDVIGAFVTRSALIGGQLPKTIDWTGPRITLVMASCIVLGAAVFAVRTVDWSAGRKEASS